MSTPEKELAIQPKKAIKPWQRIFHRNDIVSLNGTEFDLARCVTVDEHMFRIQTAEQAVLRAQDAADSNLTTDTLQQLSKSTLIFSKIRVETVKRK